MELSTYHAADGTKLEDLAEDVVCRIVSCLDMKEAARASVSCSTFLRSWGKYPCLTLDEDTLGLRRPRRKAWSEQERAEHASGFVRVVDAIIMSRHRSRGTALEALKLKLGFLREQHAPCVDRWVRFALAATTRRLELDFHPDGCYNPGRLCYDLPLSLLSGDAHAAAALEHLYFRQGALVLNGRPPPGLINMVSLVLIAVRISGDDLERLLSSCHKLHSLELEGCDGLAHVRVPHNKQLKSLAVKSCWSITRIDVSMMSCSAIESLQLAGDNTAASLLLGSSEAPAPAVTSATFDLAPRPPPHAGGNNRGIFPRLELLRLAHVVPNVETLSLTVPPTMEVSVATSRKFHRLRRADITLNMLGRAGRDDFLPLHHFLHAAPALEALTLDVKRLAPAFDATRRVRGPGATAPFRHHPSFPHQSLKAVNFTGFDGDLSALELVLYILDNARALASISLKQGWGDQDDEDTAEDFGHQIRLIHQAVARHIVPAVPSGSGIVLCFT